MYEIIGILDSILGSGKRFSGNEFYYFCPFCHHYKPKLAVNIAKKKWQCWKCGSKGTTLLSLLQRLDVSKEQIRKLLPILHEEIQFVKSTPDKIPQLTLPDEYQSLAVPPAGQKDYQQIAYRHALAYCQQRGITIHDIIRYQIGYCQSGQYHGRIIIPSYDETGQLNFFVGRDFTNNNYLNYLIPSVSRNVVGFDLYINWSLPVVLTEGVFDAMAVKRNAIPLFGKQISKKIQEKIIREGVQEVYLALDDDALTATLAIAQKLMNQGVTVYVIELPGKDPSEIGFVAMQHLIRNARPLTFHSLVEQKLKGV